MGMEHPILGFRRGRDSQSEEKIEHSIEVAIRGLKVLSDLEKKIREVKRVAKSLTSHPGFMLISLDQLRDASIVDPRPLQVLLAIGTTTVDAKKNKALAIGTTKEVNLLGTFQLSEHEGSTRKRPRDVSSLVLDVCNGGQGKDVVSAGLGAGLVSACHGRVDSTGLSRLLARSFQLEALRVFAQTESFGRIVVRSQSISNGTLNEIQWCSDRRHETDYELRMLGTFLRKGGRRRAFTPTPRLHLRRSVSRRHLPLLRSIQAAAVARRPHRYASAVAAGDTSRIDHYHSECVSEDL